MPRTSTTILTLLAALMLTSCGSFSHDSPQPGEPGFGAAGSVLISEDPFDSDKVPDEMWIGFDSKSAFNDYVALVNQFPDNKRTEIAGRIIIDSHSSVGFDLDPATTQNSEIAIPELITTIDFVKSSPSKFAQPIDYAIQGSVIRIVSH